MNHHALNIPEIVEEISRHLDLKDKVNCLVVSKAFHLAFVPGVWRSITVSRPNSGDEMDTRPSCPSGDSLQRHKHYIQELKLKVCFPDEYLSLQGCDRLRTLEVVNWSGHFGYHLYNDKDDSLDSSSDQGNNGPNQDSSCNDDRRATVRKEQGRVLAGITKLISRHHSTLNRIVFQWDHIAIISPTVEFWRAVAQCTNIGSLYLAFLFVPQECLSSFLDACALPRRLKLESTILGEAAPSDDESGQREDTSKDNQDAPFPSHRQVLPGPRYIKMSSRIWDPHFRRYSQRSMQSPLSQAKILRMCTNLEELSWRGYWTAPIFFGYLSRDPWNLDRLKQLDLKSQNVGDEDLAPLFSQMKVLEQLVLNGTQLGPLSLHELTKDRRYANSRVEHPGAGPQWRLCDTIETLYIDTCVGVTSPMIQHLLENCTSLRVMVAGSLTVTDIARGRDWVCRDLKALRVRLEADRSFWESDAAVIATAVQDVERTAALTTVRRSQEVLDMQAVVFSRIGALQELEELSVTHNAKSNRYTFPGTLNLKVRPDGLELWANLKKLKYFNCAYDKYQVVGMEELKWMTVNWPELLHFSCHAKQRETELYAMMMLLEKKNIVHRFCLG
ncbi:hypothetical protein BGZ99_005421 [Dissophora globulifera]|uniref:F-box domain-containing protein n=1 Tax=Dissophora globulifera TaxID=979702 RepID=A0A9P6RV98_9FUNG|nr:hypothetical protein BGZ99_005421 [Dissophora globulifera]